MIVVFLQNAWAHEPCGALAMQNNRRLWLYATASCRSGDRLRLLLGEDCFERDDIWFDNTTPIVGCGSGSKLPPQPAHMRLMLESKTPELVIACGRQAEMEVLKIWAGPLLVVPHPAARFLTSDLYREGNRMILAGISKRIALRQRRGSVETEDLGTPNIK